MSPEIRDIFERVRAVSKDHHEQVWLKINKLLEGKGFGKSLKSGKFDKITNYEQLRLALYKEITQKNVMEDVSNDDWLHAWTTMKDIMNKLSFQPRMCKAWKHNLLQRILVLYRNEPKDLEGTAWWLVLKVKKLTSKSG